jgi:hypothetical protein
MRRRDGTRSDTPTPGYARLAADAIHAHVFGTPITICSLHALLEMKRAAGRPQDLEDLQALQALED